MNCSQERSVQLMEYAEGSLPPDEAAELEGHLSFCGSCREELESWRQLEARLRALPLVSEPVSFKSSVMSRVAASRPAPVPMAYRPVDPVVAAALGFIVLGLGAFLSGVGDLSSWELRFDTGYWLELMRQALNNGLELSAAAGATLLRNLGEAAYTGIMDSAPVLMAALLLALFALGPSEIMSALRVQRTGNE